MQQMFSFFQDDFAKSEFGHYFCPFFTFPKKSWKKNTPIYIINGPTYLKPESKKKDLCPSFYLKYYKNLFYIYTFCGNDALLVLH